MSVNNKHALDVRAEMNIQSPSAEYQIQGDGGVIQCTITGKKWKRDLWQLRQSLFKRQIRRQLSKQLDHAELRLDVMHEGRLVAQLGHGAGHSLFARLLGFEHGKIYLSPLMH